MTFGRWLLVHSLSISILIMLGTGYFFKNELKLNEAYHQLLQIDTHSISLASKAVTDNPAISKQAVVSKKSESIVENKNTEIETNKTIKNKNTEVTNNEQTGFVFTPITKSKNKETQNTASTIDEISKKVATPKQSSVTSVKESHQNKQAPEADNLLLARQAYWNKDYPLAIEYYAKEMNKMPNSPDLYGELGNLYYDLNEFELASTNYLEAGKIMLNLGDDTRAKQIYNILMSIAPKKAEKLLSIKNDKYQ